jgi:hypothetical protein
MAINNTTAKAEKSQAGFLEKIAIKEIATYFKYFPTIRYIDPHSGKSYASSLSPALFKDKNCPLLTEFSLQKVEKISLQKPYERRNPLKKYEMLALEAQEGHIDDKTLIDAAKILEATRPVVMSEDENREKHFFKGLVRGCTVYADRSKAHITEALNELDMIPGTALFYTVTLNREKFCNNILKAWQAINGMRDKFIRRMRQRGILHYVEVCEAQYDGYPHIHIICKWENETIKHYIDHTGKWRIKDKKLWKTIKDMWMGGISDILVVKNGGVAGYVNKYISKGICLGDVKKMEKVGKLTEDNRKLLLGVMLPILAKRRMWSASAGLRRAAKQSRGERWDAIAQERFRALPGKIEYEKHAFALLALLNNATCKCLKKIVILPGNDKQIRELAEEEAVIRADLALEAKIAHLGKEIGCSRCAFVIIMRKYFEKYGLSGEKSNEPIKYWQRLLKRNGIILPSMLWKKT